MFAGIDRHRLRQLLCNLFITAAAREIRRKTSGRLSPDEVCLETRWVNSSSPSTVVPCNERLEDDGPAPKICNLVVFYQMCMPRTAAEESKDARTSMASDCCGVNSAASFACIKSAKVLPPTVILLVEDT